MDYNTLLELATDLGYELAMAGAETFRVEESITRILAAYEIEAEAFVIPNCMHISIEPVLGRPLTRMRRIGFHGNNLDAVERLNGLSRTLCSRAPDPREGQIWLQAVKRSSQVYSLPIFLLGAFLGAGGFSLFFGGGWIDGLAAGLCGILVGLVNRFMDKLKANPFFSTILF